MADPPPTFATIAAELQIMILAKVFESTVVNVKYPYQTLREIPYENMKLQGDLKILMVSKSFYTAARTALFQTATFYHCGFYLGRGQRKSTRLQNAAPEAFLQFRHIRGDEAFLEQFKIACRNNRWPYEDLRSITIRLDHHGVEGKWAKDVRNSFEDLQDVISEHNIDVRFLVQASELFWPLGGFFTRTAHIKVAMDGSRCSLEEVNGILLTQYHRLQVELKMNFGEAVSLPDIEANGEEEIWYTQRQLDW